MFFRLPPRFADNLDYQPCNSQILATHKVVVDSFREIYTINGNVSAPNPVLVGRYPEDVYYGGNPWPLCTLGVAELLYDAAAQFEQAGQIDVDQYSLAFFQDIYPDAQEESYTDEALSNITQAMRTYADGFVTTVEVSRVLLYLSLHADHYRHTCHKMEASPSSSTAQQANPSLPPNSHGPSPASSPWPNAEPANFPSHGARTAALPIQTSRLINAWLQASMRPVHTHPPPQRVPRTSTQAAHPK